MVKVAKAEQFYGDGAAVMLQKSFADLEERVKQLEAQTAVLSTQSKDLVEKLEDLRKAFVKQKKQKEAASGN